MSIPDAKRLRQLEGENRAEEAAGEDTPDNAVLKDITSKSRMPAVGELW